MKFVDIGRSQRYWWSLPSCGTQRRGDWRRTRRYQHAFAFRALQEE